MIRINQLKLPYNHSEEDLLRALSKQLKINNIKNLLGNYEIVKKSIDSRKKPDIYFVYSVDVNIPNGDKIVKKLNNNNIMSIYPNEYIWNSKIDISILPSPVIVGMGPAGLFCGLMLAKAGLNPILIERGDSVDDRVCCVDEFWRSNNLNKESNVQFGEGGAGTFSDGKLNTMVKDPAGRIKYVLKTLVEHGADKQITIINKPHIGTDVLRDVVKSIRNEIISLGGTVRFNTKLTDITIENDAVTGITVNNSEYISCNKLVLAIGHSARDTFELINSKAINMVPKSFAVGLRIEHPQEMINDYSYGINSIELPEGLPVADYKVTHQCKSGRGVYSFCMCPGGYVVNASSEEGKLAVNGMSYSKRDSRNANSALIVTVKPEDFDGQDVLSGVRFQNELEKRAYQIGKGNIPIQLYGDYKEGLVSKELGEVIPCTKGKTEFADLNLIFPEYINDAIKEGIEGFAKQIPGYDRNDAVLLGVESRTSSPVKILRDDETFQSNINGIYPCGEGGGYAGGITSACVDGIKVAEKIFSDFSPKM